MTETDISLSPNEILQRPSSIERSSPFKAVSPIRGSSEARLPGSQAPKKVSEILTETFKVMARVLLLMIADLFFFFHISPCNSVKYLASFFFSPSNDCNRSKVNNAYYEMFGEPFFDQTAVFQKDVPGFDQKGEQSKNKQIKRTIRSNNSVLVIFCHPSNQDSYCATILQQVIRSLETIRQSQFQDCSTHQDWKDGSQKTKIDCCESCQTTGGVCSVLNYEVVDLYENQFNPILSQDELLRKRRKSAETSNTDDLKIANNVEIDSNAEILRLQELIRRSKYLIFIYPVWWNNLPAMLKGFCDRTFTPGFAYQIHPNTPILDLILSIASRVPLLNHILQMYASVGFLRGKQAFIFRTLGGPASGPQIFGFTTSALESSILKFCGLLTNHVREITNLDNSMFSEKKSQEFLQEVDRLLRQKIQPHP